MNFTDSPFERMMKQLPRYSPVEPIRKPPKGSPCRGCAYWLGGACVGTCYRELLMKPTAGQVGPKSGGEG